MNVQYKRDEKVPDAILVRKFEGEVTVDEIIASWKYLLENSMLNAEIKGVINDMTDCNLRMSMDSFQKLLSFLRSEEVFHRIKLAVISNDPKTIIFPVLGEKKEKELYIKPFATSQAAIHWIINQD